MTSNITVDIHRDALRMKKQALWLMQKQFRDNVRKNRNFLLLFFLCNLISLLLVFTLKERVAVGVSGWFLFFTAFLWLGAVVFGGTALFNYMEGRKMTRRSIEEYLANTPQSQLKINEEGLEYITGQNTLRYTWDVFTEWFEKEGTLFLVPNQQPLQAFYFSAEDIGADALSNLRALAVARIR